MLRQKRSYKNDTETRKKPKTKEEVQLKFEI